MKSPAGMERWTQKQEALAGLRMRWRYLEDGREQGPVEEAALRDLVGQGRIHLETQVSPEDLNQWRPYREAIGAPLFQCRECGKTFTAEEMIRFVEAWVCAG